MNIPKILAFTLFSALSLSENARAQSTEPLTAAVLDFQVGSEDFGKKGQEAAILLGAQLSASPALILVERQELEKILGEQELGLSGTVDQASAAKIGSLTGAKVLVTGRIFGAGDKFYVVAKIMGTETSRVYGEVVTFNDLSGLDKAIEQLAPKITDVVEKRGETLLAKPEDPAAQIERWKKLIAGRKLPSVTVDVTEEHLTRQVIDPAVQTQLRKSLLDLGFEVIDAKKSQKPADVAISGEAFSEVVGRRGNLISCRARVEIKAVRSASGELLFTDSETASAVDLAENVAAKRALEKAAVKLIDRLLPKIVTP